MDPIAVFQPHRYSRTKDCLGQYKDIFNPMDRVYVTDIYSARESPITGLSSALIMEELSQDSKAECHFAHREKLAGEIVKDLRPHDVIISLGAGDITEIGSGANKQVNPSPTRKLQVGVLYGGRSLEHDISLLSARNVIKYLQRRYL